MGKYLIKILYIILLFFAYVLPKDLLALANDSRLAFLINLFIFLFYSIYLYREYKRQLKIHNPNGFGKFTISISLILFIISMMAFLVFLIIVIRNYVFENLDLNSSGYYEQSSIEIFNIFITAPIIEELIFRGMFYNLFFNKKNLRNHITLVFVSSFIFSYLHTFNFSILTLYYFCVSVILGVTYLRTKNILFPILLHSFVSIASSIIIV